MHNLKVTSPLKLAGRIIPRSGGYDTPQLTAEAISKACFGIHTRDSTFTIKKIFATIQLIMSLLNRKFYERDTLQVARGLLGKKLVRQVNGLELSGIIVETEAYCGETDSACHAHRGKTPRNAVMFGKPGHAYVYFTYGMHYMLNLVTETEGNPCAVLVRAIVPVMGVKEMEARRKRKGSELTNGPAKICQALNIDKSLNGWDLTLGSKLWVENYKSFPEKSILATPRIGINYAKDEHRKALWRFLVKSSSKA